MSEWSATAVAALDRHKEQLAYLRVWQGILIVTDISLVGWLMSFRDQSPAFVQTLAFMAFGILGVIVLLAHRRIERHIADVGRL